MIRKALSAAIIAFGLTASAADAAMTVRPMLTMQVKSAHGLVGQKVTLLKVRSLSQRRNSYLRKR